VCDKKGEIEKQNTAINRTGMKARWQQSQRNVHKRLHLTGGSRTLPGHGGYGGTHGSHTHIKAQATRIDGPAAVPAAHGASKHTVRNNIYI